MRPTLDRQGALEGLTEARHADDEVKHIRQVIHFLHGNAITWAIFDLCIWFGGGGWPGLSCHFDTLHHSAHVCERERDACGATSLSNLNLNNNIFSYRSNP